MSETPRDRWLALVASVPSGVPYTPAIRRKEATLDVLARRNAPAEEMHRVLSALELAWSEQIKRAKGETR